MPQTINPSPADQEILAALKNGDQEALGLLYDKYSGVLLGLIMHLIPDKEIAETILSESFVAIWKAKDSFDPDKTRLLTWMIKIARETAVRGVESGKYQPNNAPDSLLFVGEQNKIPALLPDLALKDFCFRLSPTEKAALELIYLKGYSCAQAALAMNLSETEFKLSLQSAIRNLGAGKVA